MCGRTSLFIEPSELEDRFDATIAPDIDYRPRYNIAPGADLEIITNENPETITQHHWGLIPFWEDTPQEGIINARSETVNEKNVFKKAWESRPCLVLSSGFYEWQQPNGGPKTPYRIHRKDDPAFAMGGIWEVWENDEGSTIPCVTILTTDPNDLIEPIHDRMPVVLPRDEESTWLTEGPEERAALCRPYPGDNLTAYEISKAVNNPGNDEPTVLEPVESEQSGLDEFA